MANNQVDLSAIYGISGNPSERILNNENMRMGESTENNNNNELSFLDDVSIFSNGTSSSMNNTSQIQNMQSGMNGLSNNQNTEDLKVFLNSQTGRLMEVHFKASENQTICLTGFLMGIGSDYILLNERGTNNFTTCSSDNIIYVRIFY